MHKTRMSGFAIAQLQAFVSSYKDIFLGLYSDTGVFNEELIRKNYKTLSLKLYQDILQGSKIILGNY